MLLLLTLYNKLRLLSVKCVKVIKLNSQLHCCAGLAQIEGKVVQAVLFMLTKTETEMAVNGNTSIPLTKTEIHAKTEIETEMALHFR